MRTAPLARLAVVVTLATSAACGHDSTAPSTRPGSRFDAEVTGALTRQITGEAYAGTKPIDSTTDDYLMVLSDGPLADAESVVLLEHIGVPSTNTYAALSIDANYTGTEFLGTFYSATDRHVYYSTGGTVQIESISAAHVQGRFDMTMRTDDAARSPQLTVRVLGTFYGINSGIPNVSRAGAARGLVMAKLRPGGRIAVPHE